MYPVHLRCLGVAAATTAAVALSSHRRSVSTFGDGGVGGSVLGTSSLTGDLLKDLQEDLQREQSIRKHGIGETLANYVQRAELSHMESPEADRKFLEKFDSQVDDFFAKIPTPEDPMKAALARTPDELEEEAAVEMVREAVREAYLRKLDAKAAEELRLKHAMKRMQEKGYQPLSEEDRRWDPDMAAASSVNAEAVRAAVAAAEKARAHRAADGDGYHRPAKTTKARQETTFEEEMAQMAEGLDESALEEELQAMQEKMKMMEALLGSKKKRRSTPSKSED